MNNKNLKIIYDAVCPATAKENAALMEKLTSGTLDPEELTEISAPAVFHERYYLDEAAKEVFIESAIVMPDKNIAVTKEPQPTDAESCLDVFLTGGKLERYAWITPTEKEIQTVKEIAEAEKEAYLEEDV